MGEMELLKYEAFLKTIECGQLTKAAEELNYTQSGVSQLLSRLERDWGISLLQRSRSGVTITSDGSMLLPYIQQVCNAQHELMNMVSSLKGLQTGLVRIGVFYSIASHWLPPIIKRFETAYPNIGFEVLNGTYSQIEEWILEGRVDLGFVRLPTNPALSGIFLAQDRLLVIMGENHPMAGCEVFPLERLPSESFIQLDEGENNESNETLRLFLHHKIMPHVRFHAGNDFAVMSMVENGLGISVFPELALHRSPYRLIKKELDPPAYRELGIAYRQKERMPPIVLRFLECVQEFVGQLSIGLETQKT